MELHIRHVCFGDFDGNDNVTATDLATLTTDFGQTACASFPFCKGYVDGDTDVDGSDLAIMALEYGRNDCP